MLLNYYFSRDVRKLLLGADFDSDSGSESKKAEEDDFFMDSSAENVSSGAINKRSKKSTADGDMTFSFIPEDDLKSKRSKERIEAGLVSKIQMKSIHK